MQHGALPANSTCTGTPWILTTGVVVRSSPVTKSARKVGPLVVDVLNAVIWKVTALVIAPSPVPVALSEKIPGGAVRSTVIVVENVPLLEVTTRVCTPAGVDGLITALICPGDTKNIPAAEPPTVMLTPASDIGGFCALAAKAVLVDRLAPKIVIMLPGANVVSPSREAALTT